MHTFTGYNHKSLSCISVHKYPGFLWCKEPRLQCLPNTIIYNSHIHIIQFHIQNLSYKFLAQKTPLSQCFRLDHKYQVSTLNIQQRKQRGHNPPKANFNLYTKPNLSECLHTKKIKAPLLVCGQACQICQYSRCSSYPLFQIKSNLFPFNIRVIALVNITRGFPMARYQNSPRLPSSFSSKPHQPQPPKNKK